MSPSTAPNNQNNSVFVWNMRNPQSLDIPFYFSLDTVSLRKSHKAGRTPQWWEKIRINISSYCV